MLERLVMFIINIFCPPVTVICLTGLSTDAFINTCLFIAGLIPGHIHGFYLSCTYFHRKNKVEKNKYPGGAKTFIFSKIVWNGGASDERVEELRREEQARKEGRRGSRRRGSRMVNRNGKEKSIRGMDMV